MAVPRTSKGQFVKGVGGNPSGVRLDGELRTKQKIIKLRDNLELAIRQGPLNAVRVCNILNKMIAMAEQGDTRAAKLVLAVALQTGIGDGDKTPAGITIKIENATFKAAAPTPTVSITPTVKPITIDAEVTEI